jgi:uncharacterized protein YjbI with pentapeptide repeats
MNEKLTTYVNGVFAPYDEVKSVAELKADLLADLQDRFRELQSQGMDDATAFSMTVDSIGDIEQTVLEVANSSGSLERQVLTNFSAANLAKGDFAGVTVHNGRFEWSALHGADFSGADVTGSMFKGSDVGEANFDGANLTDCTFSVLDLTGASFNKSILVRTKFNKSGLTRAKFIDVNMIDVAMNMVDLREATFENCTFSGVDFKYCDMRGQCLDGLSFVGVKFDRAMLNDATFKGARLRDVSFHPEFALTNRGYRAITTICFDGAVMDKLTYAALNGLNADLSNVTVR